MEAESLALLSVLDILLSYKNPQDHHLVAIGDYGEISAVEKA
jgi:hypothetical protein